MRSVRVSLVSLATLTALLAVGLPALGGSHSWAPWEFYSNSSGTIQYIVLWNPSAPAENGIASRDIRTNLNISATHGTNLPGNTTDRYLLAATAGFAALPGAPTPDFPLLANDFFNNNAGDTVTFWTYGFSWSSFTFGPSAVPDGGSQAFRRDDYTTTTGSLKQALPLNYDGETFAPAGVSSSLTVGKITSDGGRLLLEWDDDGCLGTPNFQIIHGFGSDLPSSLGGNYGVQPATPAAQCAASSPEQWIGVPNPAMDPSRLLWFLVQANDTVSREGSWGTDSDGNERSGPGLGGASNQCGSTAKSLINTCGQ